MSNYSTNDSQWLGSDKSRGKQNVAFAVTVNPANGSAAYRANSPSSFTNKLVGRKGKNHSWLLHSHSIQSCSRVLPTARSGGRVRSESWCVLSPAPNAHISQQGCYWWQCDVPFSTRAISLCVMAALFYNVIPLIWKAMALDSKSNQARLHLDENELIKKSYVLAQRKGIKPEREQPTDCFHFSHHPSSTTHLMLSIEC